MFFSNKKTLRTCLVLWSKIHGLRVRALHLHVLLVQIEGPVWYTIFDHSLLKKRARQAPLVSSHNQWEKVSPSLAGLQLLFGAKCQAMLLADLASWARNGWVAWRFFHEGLIGFFHSKHQSYKYIIYVYTYIYIYIYMHVHTTTIRFMSRSMLHNHL